jgi:hypothetical protein
MKRLRLAGLAVGLGLASLALWVWAPAASAKSACLVTNQTTSVSYADLQTAVSASTSGDTLMVKGICVGGTYIGYTTLTITGEEAKGFSKPTLDGGQRAHLISTRPLTIDHATVAINSLTITGGYAPGDYGGAVFNVGGTVTLNDSTVRDNSAQYGGGIYNAFGSEFSLNNSRITGNTAEGASSTGAFGGGIYNRGTLTLSDSTISDNTTPGAGGGVSAAGGSETTLTDSKITNNTAVVGGGGIYLSSVNSSAPLDLYGTSKINNNQATGDPTANRGFGGGIAAVGMLPRYGSVTLHDSSSVTNNTATYLGSGIYVGATYLAMLDNSSVHGNAGALRGGGVYAAASIVILADNSSIQDNTATNGGGIAYYNSSLGNCNPGAGGNVYNNAPDDIWEYSI